MNVGVIILSATEAAEDTVDDEETAEDEEDELEDDDASSFGKEPKIATMHKIITTKKPMPHAIIIFQWRGVSTAR